MGVPPALPGREQKTPFVSIESELAGNGSGRGTTRFRFTFSGLVSTPDKTQFSAFLAKILGQLPANRVYEHAQVARLFRCHDLAEASDHVVRRFAHAGDQHPHGVT